LNNFRRSYTRSPRVQSPDGQGAEDEYPSKGKTNPAVQSLIDKQKRQLKEEFERARNQNALRNYNSNNVHSVYENRTGGEDPIQF
jgi:hypothetical protein